MGGESWLGAFARFENTTKDTPADTRHGASLKNKLGKGYTRLLNLIKQISDGSKTGLSYSMTSTTTMSLYA